MSGPFRSVVAVVRVGPVLLSVLWLLSVESFGRSFESVARSSLFRERRP
jgi:hypothetical protein